ncbi:cob(I)yrinic acid a,c-diamide adenosyltransferase [Jannaschia sp. CCS1]|nr:cob(I)yrinic acid a,c-diamide adenosyltransferase [Jannaschia sp. CCS1]
MGRGPCQSVRLRTSLRSGRRRTEDMTEDTTAENARHTEKMRKIKAARDKMMETKTEEKGLIMVHTGPGKGKSSSGFGMVMRSIQHGMGCAVVQFIKGNWATGEKSFLRERFADECRFFVSGEGFTWETQDKERDIAAAQNGWTIAQEQILDPEIDFVLLDEINIALRYDYLDIDEVVDFLLTRKPRMTHVCLTGRNAKPELIEAADLVTEMTLIKHPFRDGVKAQKGVEF